MPRPLLLIPLLLSACATGGAGAEPTTLELIEFEINSWGRSIDRWEVRADGTTRHARTISENGPRSPVYRIEHREFTVGAAGFERLAELADALPEPRPDGRDCELRATDLPYGTLRLSGGGTDETMTFDTGCQDEPYQAFVGQLRAMDTLVSGWAEEHAATRVEQVGRARAVPLD